MDTLEFLQTILPPEGVYFMGLMKVGHTGIAHRAYTDLEVMAQAIDEMSQASSMQVYHACGSYLHPVVEREVDGRTERIYRKEVNWGRAKTFWLDIDCGQEKFDQGKGYLTQRDAAKALFGFVDAIGWPRPMLVDSGSGLHAYWPLTQAILPASWTKVATALKATLAHCGILADPTRTADFSSILRPPGTYNRKAGGAKQVVVKSRCEPCNPRALADALSAYVKQHGVKLIRQPSTRAASTDLNSDLTAHLANRPYLDSDGNLVADKCAQVAAMRDTKGDVGYDHWRGVIGILKHCVGGEALAEDWTSERLINHDSDNWKDKYDSWNADPTRCDFFAKCNPSGCEGCEFQGKITSPIALGRIIPIAKEQAVPAVDDEGNEVEVIAPALTTGYVWANGLLARLLPDKDGVLQALPFSTVLFYPTARIRAEDGTYRIGMRMHLPNKKLRDFDMSYEAMASQTDMLRSLAKYELTQSNHKDAGSHMAAYLRDQLEDLKRKVDEVNTLTAFGWRGDDFLAGDRLYCADGTVRKVLVGGTAKTFIAAFPEPRGSLARYASALNALYNRPGAEHWQYAVCSGWSSVLAPMGEDLYRGLMLALRGGDSGKGKTTCCYASLYAFGDADQMAIKSKDGATYNAIVATFGAFNNLPVLLDELTNMDGPVFSDLAYQVSLGKGRSRLQSKGGQVGFAETTTWAMCPFVTGNKDFHGLLAAHQANSQAEAARLIQIDVDRYRRVELIAPDKPYAEMTEDELMAHRALEADLVRQCMDSMKASAGAAGDAILRYVVANQRKLMDEVRDKLNDVAQVVNGEKYRLYRNHAACTLVMARVAKDLGIVDFDLEALERAALAMLQELAEKVNETNVITTEDAFNRMMADLAPRIVTTSEFRDKRHIGGPELVMRRPNGPVAGRYVLGSRNDKAHAGHIMLNQKDVRDWCVSNRLDYANIVDHLESAGALVKRNDKITLTRGTDLPIVQARCIVVDALKLDRDALSVVSNHDGSTEILVA